MIKMHFKLPRTITVAVSGGVDSMAALHFLSRNHDVTALHIDHNTGNSPGATEMVETFCHKIGAGFRTEAISGVAPETGLEEYWRNERYRIFHSVDGEVVTCHHVEDCIETWVWSAIQNFNPTLIHDRNKNVVRPFLTTSKADFISWARRNDVPWIEDASNLDTRFTRNYIRHVAMPHVLHINPGIAKNVRKKIIERRCGQ